MSVKKLWFPCYSQIVIAPPNRVGRLYSLWVGLTAPILNLPRMAWSYVIAPVFFGFFIMFTFTLTSVIGGIAGRAAGIQILPDVKVEAEAGA